jgi:uncharacterized OsmC-like protein
MSTSDIAAALQRARSVLERRPDMGLHEDAPASATWRGGTRVVTRHANGTELPSDMPAELGGSGDRITPGWLFRAGMASCAATSIAMAAAAEGMVLTELEVSVHSRSDTRALLGMAEADGGPVCASPQDVQLHVRVAAREVSAERLRTLVAEACRRSPIPNAVQDAVPVDVRIEAIAA